MVEQRLRALDREIGEGSWWRMSQRLHEKSNPLFPPPPAVPAFAETYHTTFEGVVAARRRKRKERQHRAHSNRTEQQILAANCERAVRLRFAKPGDIS